MLVHQRVSVWSPEWLFLVPLIRQIPTACTGHQEDRSALWAFHTWRQRLWGYPPVVNLMAVGQNLVPLLNVKIAGKWMFIPLKMVLIGIDPYSNGKMMINHRILGHQLKRLGMQPFCQSLPVANSVSPTLALPSSSSVIPQNLLISGKSFPSQ